VCSSGSAQQSLEDEQQPSPLFAQPIAQQIGVVLPFTAQHLSPWTQST
jgi:hypothetical protein